MKLAQHLLAICTISPIPISLASPSTRLPRDRIKSPYAYDPHIIPSVQSIGKMHWLAVESRPDLNNVALLKEKILVKRTINTKMPSDPDEPLAALGAGAPTLSEAQDVLSAEEFETYLNVWETHKAHWRAYLAAKKVIREGGKLTAEQVKELDTLRAYDERLRAWELEVQDKLVSAGKARPEMVAQVRERRRRQYSKAYYERSKTRLSAIKERIDKGVATEEDVLQWQLAERQRETTAKQMSDWYQAKQKAEREAPTKESLERKRLDRQRRRTRYQADKKKAEEAKARIDAEQGTEQDRQVWKEWKAWLETNARRSSEWRAKKKKSAGPQQATTPDIINDENTEPPLPSEDGSNSPRDTASKEMLSKDAVHPLQSFTGSLLHGARRLIENIGDKWRMVPWNENRPTSLSPGIWGIPLLKPILPGPI
ncbi:MAG: hypothetical protein M1816_002530 [Peltula sp. TS41687]|nr:MAG: hypothetical protein M1816_002530 [Peltula sp. TS41687]